MMMFFQLTASAPAALTSTAPSSRHMMVYIGTNTSSSSLGIYRFGLDVATGSTTPVELAATVRNPTFLAASSDRRFLYAVSEISDFEGKKSGGVSSFSMDLTTGNLTLLNQQPSGGRGPCHVCVTPDGRYVATANYSSGSIALLPVKPDGSLTSPTMVIQHTGSSVNPKRQEGPHAHSVNFDPAGRFLFAADLGIDQVKIYRLDPATDSVHANDPAHATVQPGAGPRHLAFHPGGRFVYVITEMGNTMTVFSCDPDAGALREVQTTSTLPAGYTDKTFAAEVRMHPSGKFLYGSNRGHDSIAIFKIDEASGMLTPIGHEPTGGKIPRNFNIDPSGQWLLAANQDSDNVVLYHINENGTLSRTGEITGISKPVCVLFVPVK